jgi:hypothetical protein
VIKIEGFSEEGRTFGECKCYPIKLNGIEAAVVRPERSRRMARARMEAKKRHHPMVAGSDSHFCRHGGPGSNRDRGRKCRGGSGGHPGRAHKGGGQADAAAVFHWEYRAVDMPDCEEEGGEKKEGVKGKSYICISIKILIEHD